MTDRDAWRGKGTSGPIRVYLDNCVYHRVFDDQTQERVFIEARAFCVIIRWIEEGRLSALSSDAIEYENDLTANVERQLRVKSFLALAEDRVKLSDGSIERSTTLIGLGFSDLDALHIAMAEEGKAEYFVTCDDGIVRVAKKHHEAIGVRVRSILDFLTEVMNRVENGE